MNLSFSQPYRIIIGIVLIGLIIFVKQKYPLALPFLHTKFLKGKTNNKFLPFLYLLLPFATIFFLSLLLSGPALVSKETTEKKQARQFVIALDISYSMNADDLKPNRLEMAKNTIKNLLDQFQGDQIGLVLFAGKPFASIPLTFDTQAIKDMINEYNTETINQQNPSLQGTAIGDAILSSLTLLEGSSSGAKGSEAKGSRRISSNQQSTHSKSIILITDGSANVGVDPLIASKYASLSGITIYTIGIGSEQGGSIPLQTAFGIRRQEVEGVDTPTLSEIAKITQGRFARVTDEKAFMEALLDIANIKAGAITHTTIIHYSPLGRYLFGIILIVILISFYHSYKTRHLLRQTKSIVS